MIAAIYNLPNAYRGDDYGPISLKVKNENGEYISLLLSQMDLHVKNKKNCAIVLSWSTSDASITLSDDYTAVLNKKNGCKMLMPPGIYSYDFQVSSSLGTITYIRGSLEVIGDVTQKYFCNCSFNGGSAIVV